MLFSFFESSSSTSKRFRCMINRIDDMHLLRLMPSTSTTIYCRSLSRPLWLFSDGFPSILIFKHQLQPLVFLFQCLQLILECIKLGLPSLSAFSSALSVFEQSNNQNLKFEAIVYL